MKLLFACSGLPANSFSGSAGAKRRAHARRESRATILAEPVLGHMEHFMKATAINILAMVALIAFQFLVGCSEDRSRSNGDMKQQAETAIRDAGGADVLEREAKFILSNFQVGSDWKTTSNSGTNCPAITKLHSLLSPDGHYPWVVTNQKYLPAHVVIRFGSHAHYEYVWIFDPAHVPLGKIEGVAHLGGAVYLSEKNL